MLSHDNNKNIQIIYNIKDSNMDNIKNNKMVCLVINKLKMGSIFKIFGLKKKKIINLKTHNQIQL
jgi:hypothetical protein